MNKLFKNLSILAVIALFITACGAQMVQAQPEEQSAPKATTTTYQAVLGKSLNNKDVADFIASNNCTSSGPFQLCQSVGVVLWADADQAIKTAYLYLSNSDEFAAYKGELPLGLASGDTMASVEQKLGQPKVEHAPQAGWEPGLPDTGGTPDHIRYWAVYNRFGVTIVYNTVSADDKAATIHAILVGK
jgi:hypothetical protein